MAPSSREEGDLFFAHPRRARLDDRISAMFAPETPQDRIEAQELRQLVHQALKDLTEEELRVVELRYQHKKSPVQIASQLGISRKKMQSLEKNGLEKLRRYLEDWHGEP
jgi:RNA polymerase sigma factor (sigma-70 family)